MNEQLYNLQPNLETETSQPVAETSSDTETPKLTQAKSIYEFFETDNNKEKDGVVVIPENTAEVFNQKDVEDSVAIVPDQPENNGFDAVNVSEQEVERANTLKKINEILKDPTKFSPEQMESLKEDLFNILAGQSYEEFMANENNSELAIAIETLKQEILTDQQRQKENVLNTSKILGLEPPVSNETITLSHNNIVDVKQIKSSETPVLNNEQTETEPVNVQNTEFTQKNSIHDLINNSDSENLQQPEDLTETKNTLEIKVLQDGEEKTISISEIAALALFITADMMLFKGNSFHGIATTVGSTGAASILSKIVGYELPVLTGINFDENFIETATTEQLIDYLKQRNGNEMFMFLSGIEKETRIKMLNGEKFGGYFGKHQLNSEQISMVLNNLNENQKSNLGLSNITS